MGHAIWIPANGLANYELARERGIWGSNTRPSEQIESGSVLYFAMDAGSPRVPVNEFIIKRPNRLVVAIARSGLYKSEEVIWESEDGKTYPYRFAFEVVEEFSGFDAKSEIASRVSDEMMRAFHLSANKQSTPQSFSSESYVLRSGVLAGLRLEEEPNRIALTKIRVEQSKLRQVVVKAGSDVCALCGKVFENSLLIAAHIKPRQKCNPEEIWDIPNVAMPACLFGCDASFERGYLSVDSGKLWASPQALTLESFQEKYEPLLGRSVPSYVQSKPYFDWHFRNIALR